MAACREEPSRSSTMARYSLPLNCGGAMVNVTVAAANTGTGNTPQFIMSGTPACLRPWAAFQCLSSAKADT